MIVNRYKKSIRETAKIFVMGTRCREKAVEAKYIKGICDFLIGYDFGHPTPPKRIEIETISKCNGECSFCPANRHEGIRPLLKMDENKLKALMKWLSYIVIDNYCLKVESQH